MHRCIKHTLSTDEQQSIEMVVVLPRDLLNHTKDSSTLMLSFSHFLFSLNQITWVTVDGSSGFISKLKKITLVNEKRIAQQGSLHYKQDNSARNGVITLFFY